MKETLCQIMFKMPLFFPGAVGLIRFGLNLTELMTYRYQFPPEI